MDQLGKIDAIIRTLEKVHQKPLMFVGSDPLGVIPWLDGFNGACNLLGFGENHHEIYKKIAVERGWEWSSLRTLPSMRERGLDSGEIAKELLTIEIAVWKVIRAEISETFSETTH